MALFTLRPSEEIPGLFIVMGQDGRFIEPINAFLYALFARGRSGYTIRAYGQGLAHFFEWLHTTHTTIDEVTPHLVETYIAFFGIQPKGGACLVNPEKVGHVNRQTRKAAPSTHRQPRTINHRLSVLAAFFSFHIEQDGIQDLGRWTDRSNPVPGHAMNSQQPHGMPGRDAPKRRTAGDLHRRVPRRLPPQLDPSLVEHLIETATSWRDKALLTLLYRTGQRIGDWSSFAGRHGILGMTLTDVDERTQTITVLLKGARDEHRIPVTEDFWPLYHRYVQDEREAEVSVNALWIGLRKGRGKPLTYASFESSLRYIGQKLGANVNAHMFRHTLAQAIVNTGQLKVAQEILGHRHLETTVDVYARVDHQAMVQALQAVKSQTAAAAQENQLDDLADVLQARRYAFPYDEITLQELEQVTTGHDVSEA